MKICMLSPYFYPHAKVPNQKYCSSIDCQRFRRRLWQRSKRSNDDDYKKNQIESQNTWTKKNPGYWKAYRYKNPAKAARNSTLQNIRNRRRRTKIGVESTLIAKMDVSNNTSVGLFGPFLMVPMIAKMDVAKFYLQTIPAG